VIPGVEQARRTARSTLTSTCSITRVDRSAPRTVDPVTLAIGSQADLPVWSGPCSASPAGEGDNATMTGSIDGRLDSHVVRMPADAPMIIAGDAVTITAVGPEADPTLLDRVLVVRDATTRSTSVLRRLLCLERTDAEGVPR